MQPDLSAMDVEIADGLASPLNAAVSARDHETISMVRTALQRRNVFLAYQPVVSARNTGQIAFHEGLLRVRDPSGRTIPAADFITSVEDTEIGRILDCLSLETGLSALASDPGLRLSINMSARSIGYRRWIQILNAGTESAPSVAERLILEITESSAMIMPEVVISFMADLRQRGIAFALDDFGAGYTAFRYLRDFLFDIIKIDGQFIQGISDNPDNQVLARALLSIAQHFDMFTVAEAVERRQDAETLVKMGVDCLQGYFFGAPAMHYGTSAGETVPA